MSCATAKKPAKKWRVCLNCEKAKSCGHAHGSEADAAQCLKCFRHDAPRMQFFWEARADITRHYVGAVRAAQLRALATPRGAGYCTEKRLAHPDVTPSPKKWHVVAPTVKDAKNEKIAAFTFLDGWAKRTRDVTVDIRSLRVGTDRRRRHWGRLRSKDKRQQKRFIRVSVLGHRGFHNAFLDKAEGRAFIEAVKKAVEAL